MSTTAPASDRSVYWHNVRDYGATADGTDDRAAIQAAVDHANANGREPVYFPAGHYWIGGPITWRNGVPIRGDGRYSAVIHQTDPTKHGIDLKGADNLVIEGIGITHDHNLAPQQNGQCLFSGSSVRNVTVQDCAFHGSARQGVGFWSSGNQNIRFVRNDLRDCARAGVVIFGEGVTVGWNYLNGTGDDAIAVNTDASTHCWIGGNTVIRGAGVGEATGGGIKFHGRNTTVIGNVIVFANQYGIRGQVVDNKSGLQIATSPTRNTISNNIIHGLTDINPKTKATAGIEMREFQNVSIFNNSVYEIPGLAGIRLRNYDRDTTFAKVHGNYVEQAHRAIHTRDRHDFIDLFNNTAINTARAIEVEDPIQALHARNNSGYGITDRCVSLLSVDSGTYNILNNSFTTDLDAIVVGSMTGGEVRNYLNTPEEAAREIKSGAASYKEVKWSDLAA